MGKYSYTLLKDVVQSPTIKYHHVFGVFTKYQEQGVYLKDEGYDSLKIDLPSNCDTIAPKLKPGNILRIHRVMTVSRNAWRCIKANDIMMFSAFKDKDSENCKVLYEAKQPTIEPTDFTRKDELEKWFSDEILRISMNNVESIGWINIAFLVVDIKDLSHNRVVLVVRDGTQPNLQFNWLCPTRDPYPDESHDELVCVNIWDKHANKARKLEKGSFIVIFNLEISRAKKEGMFELHLRGGSHYGKMIRNVHHNSFLGIGFTERLAETLPRTTEKKPIHSKAGQNGRNRQTTSEADQNQPRVTANGRSHSPVVEILSDSSQSEIQSEEPLNIPRVSRKSKTSQPRERSKPCNGPGPSHETNVKSTKQPTPPSTPAKKPKNSHPIKFPHFVDIEVPSTLLKIKEYKELAGDQICSIKARVKLYHPSSQNISDYIIFICHHCNYKEPLSKDFLNQINSAERKSYLLPCLNCQEAGTTGKLVAAFWITLFLQDEDGSELSVTLSKFDVDKLLNVTALDALKKYEESSIIFSFFDYICPSGNDVSRTMETSSSPYLIWTLVREPGKDGEEYQHRVLTVFMLENQEHNDGWPFSLFE